MGIERLSWLDLDPCYMQLGNTMEGRKKRYSQFINEVIPKAEWETIREAVQRGQLTGNNYFIESVAEKIGRRIEFRKQGRPKAKEK